MNYSIYYIKYEKWVRRRSPIIRIRKYPFSHLQDHKQHYAEIFNSNTSQIQFVVYIFSHLPKPPQKGLWIWVLFLKMEGVVGAAIRSPMAVGLFMPRSAPLVAAGFDFSRSQTKIGFCRKYPTISHSRPLHRRATFGMSKIIVVRASSSDSAGSVAPIAPLQLESPVGQFLSQILSSHPHLVPAAVDQQLEQLQTDRDAENETQPEDASATGTDLVLYRRIAEVKDNERKKAVEEILYALVVKKFMDANVSLIPNVAPSSSDPSGRVDTWPSQDEKLQHLHSPEAYEMIQNHLSLILGNHLGNLMAVAQISKLRAGQVYAASVMYGYFLKRIDQRFQLEKTMKILPGAAIQDDEPNTQLAKPGDDAADATKWAPPAPSHPELPFGGPGPESDRGVKGSRLRTYVMSFDGETLQRYATIRSKEAVGIIEKHTEALFGRPEIVISPEGTIDPTNQEEIKISFGGLKRLVLEAVTFGSFLWDVESYVDSRYHFVAN